MLLGTTHGKLPSRMHTTRHLAAAQDHYDVGSRCCLSRTCLQVTPGDPRPPPPGDTVIERTYNITFNLKVTEHKLSGVCHCQCTPALFLHSDVSNCCCVCVPAFIRQMIACMYVFHSEACLCLQEWLGISTAISTCKQLFAEITDHHVALLAYYFQDHRRIHHGIHHPCSVDTIYILYIAF
jgi:hypothetical protein